MKPKVYKSGTTWYSKFSDGEEAVHLSFSSWLDAMEGVLIFRNLPVGEVAGAYVFLDSADKALNGLP